MKLSLAFNIDISKFMCKTFYSCGHIAHQSIQSEYILVVLPDFSWSQFAVCQLILLKHLVDWITKCS